MKEKIILITGASKGLGLCLAKMLCKDNIVIGIFNSTKINNEFIDFVKCNLKKENDIKKLMNYIKNTYGKIDVLINCAATTLDNDLFDKTKKEFMDVLEVNLVGTFLICKYSSTIMNKGCIINVLSTDAIDTFSTISMDYAASKAGLLNLTKNLANRLPDIKICGIAPNWIDTETVLEMNEDYLKSELKRVGQNKLIKKEKVADKIVEMIIDDKILSGTIIRMDK